MKTKKYLMKLIIVFFSILFMMCLITLALFVYKNYQITNIQFENKNNRFVQQIQENVDNKLTIAFNLARQMKTYDEVKKYALTKSQNYFYVITKANERIIKSFQPFCYAGFTIGITKIEDQKVITPENVVDTDKYLTAINLSDVGRAGYYDFVEGHNADSLYYLLENEEDASTFTIVKKEILDNGGIIVFIITFFNNQIFDKIELSSNEYLFFLKGEYIIAKNTGIGFNNDKEVSEIKDESVNSQIDLSENKHLIYSRDSSISELKELQYNYIILPDTMSSFISELKNNFIIYIVVILVLSILIALMIALKLYKPVRSILTKIKVYSGEDSQEDEFSYMEKTMLGINKKNTNLLNFIEKNKISLKDKFFNDLIKERMSTEEISDQIKSLKLDYLNGLITLSCIKFGVFYGSEDNLTREALFAIKSDSVSVIKDNLLNNWKCDSIEMDDDDYIFVIEGNDVDGIRKILNSTVASINISHRINIIAAIGKPIANVFENSGSFNEISRLFEYRGVFDNKLVITYDDLKQIKNEAFYYPLNLEKQLIDNVVNGKNNEMMLVLNYVLNENLRNRQLDSNALSKFIHLMSATIQRILQNMDIPGIDALNGDNLLDFDVKLFESRKQLHNKIQSIFNSIINRIEEQSKKIDDDIAQSLILYIGKNYDKNISLVDIADQFNLSPAYISVIFKNEVGTNFKEYLSLFRMKKAKEILGFTNTKIKDVALKVGFTNTNTFIRAFKKYEGSTPGEYMISKSENDQDH